MSDIRRKCLVLIVAALAFCWCAYGAPVTEEQARTAVSNWLIANPAPLDAVLGREIESVTAYLDPTDSTETLFWVVDLVPDGFVIVGADDLVEPIIAFAPHGRFVSSYENPLGAMVSKDLPARIDAAKSAGGGKVSFISPAQQKWGRLLAAKSLSNLSDKRVPEGASQGLLQTKWSQENVNGLACFNYYTPPNAEGSTGNYVCGCVATAVAQVLYYHQYPQAPLTRGPFSVTITDVGGNSTSPSRYLRGGDGSGGAYQYGQMPLDPVNTTADQTLAKRSAVGALTYDAGVAFNMHYTPKQSATWAANRPLVNVFGYANAISGYRVSGSNVIDLQLAEVIKMANSNLDAGYPVLFAIFNAPWTSGHEIVCDGYGYDTNTLYHHLNMGWGGICDSWYNLPSISAAIDFSVVGQCIYNLFPQGTGEIISGRVLDQDSQPIEGASVTAAASGGGSYGPVQTNSKGIFAIVHVPSSKQHTISVSKSGYTFASQQVSTGTSVGDWPNGSGPCGNVWNVNFTPTSGSGLLPPVLTSPTNGSVVAGTQVVFNWNPSEGATQYKLQLGYDSAFVSQQTSDPTTLLTMNGTGFPNDGTTYYWRVAAGNGVTWSDWSLPWRFASGTPATPPAPTLATPTNGSNAPGTGITFTWGAAARATQYKMQVTTDGVSTPYESSIKTSPAAYWTGFPNNGTVWRWRAAAGNSSGWSDWSTEWSFTNGIPLPAIPALISPANTSYVPGANITFSCGASANATQYRMQIALDAAFTTPWTSNTQLAPSFDWVGFPNNRTVFYWRAAAGNSSGWSNWGSPWSFTNGLPLPPATPTLISPQNGSSVAGTQMTFSWSTVSGATGYCMQLGYNADLSGGQTTGVLTAPNCTWNQMPNDGTTVYWRAAAGNTGGWSNWSPIWSVRNGGGGCFGKAIQKQDPLATREDAADIFVMAGVGCLMVAIVRRKK